MGPVRARSRSRDTFLQKAGGDNAADIPISKSADPALSWVEQQKLQIEYRPLAELRPYRRNPRTHSRTQIDKIAASIITFGWVNPIVVDAQGEIVAGHGRLAAAKRLSIERVPVIQVAHLTPEQVRAYRLADNRIAEQAGWDDQLLAVELKGLIEIETSFEITVTGFEMAQIDLLLTGQQQSGEPDPADIVEEPAGPAVSQKGDLWLLGAHRLLCADARDSVSYEALLAGEKAQMVFTDPPYNVRINGHVSGLGKVKHREFVMASGEMSEAEFTAFLQTIFGSLAAASVDGAIHFICSDWRHLRQMLSAGDAAYSELKNLCVWVKDNGGLGSLYRSRHELVLVYKHGTAAHVNNILLGASGRNRTNVWEQAGVNTFRRGREDELAMHPTVKPVALVADAIMDTSKRGGIVLDAFGGSGTTLIAAQRTGRRGYLLELDPLYVDTTCRRWQKLFGEPARHAATGLTFDEVATRRLSGEEVRHG